MEVWELYSQNKGLAPVIIIYTQWHLKYKGVAYTNWQSLFYVFCGHRTLPWPCTLGITGRTTDWPSPPAVTKAERLTLVWLKRSGCQTSSLFTPSVLSFTTPPWKTSCSEFIQMETFSTASGTAWRCFPETRCLYNSCETSSFPEAFCCVLRFHRKGNKMFSALYFEVSFVMKAEFTQI